MAQREYLTMDEAARTLGLDRRKVAHLYEKFPKMWERSDGRQKLHIDDVNKMATFREVWQGKKRGSRIYYNVIEKYYRETYNEEPYDYHKSRREKEKKSGQPRRSATMRAVSDDRPSAIVADGFPPICNALVYEGYKWLRKEQPLAAPEKLLDELRDYFYTCVGTATSLIEKLSEDTEEKLYAELGHQTNVAAGKVRPRPVSKTATAPEQNGNHKLSRRDLTTPIKTILGEHPDEWMTSRKIADEIIRCELFAFRSRTPSDSVSTSLRKVREKSSVNYPPWYHRRVVGETAPGTRSDRCEYKLARLGEVLIFQARSARGPVPMEPFHGAVYKGEDPDD